MPLTHVRTFRVRHYECDAYGCLNHTNYLRYMQEAAFDASAAAGYDFARYTALKRQWLIRETNVEYLHPLLYGESVQVKTWVADFRRVRSRRNYEFRKTESGQLVAQAHTDWVFLDSTTWRPTSIPPEMMAAFFPEGPPQSALPRNRFPAAPPPPPRVFEQRRRVEWQDIDTAQHVNNAVYLAYMEDCGIKAAAAHGWPPARTRAEGFTIVARRYQIEYRQQALLGDELKVATWASDIEDSTAVRHYVVTRARDDVVLTRARTLWTWVDVATGKPIDIPASLLADFAPNISST